jgi:hypothetical protein
MVQEWHGIVYAGRGALELNFTTYAERPVLLGSQERIPVRLIAFRLSPEVTNRQRQKIYEKARKKGVT